MNLSEMTYKELVELSIDLPQMMAIKRANEVKDALREVMAIYGLTKEEMKSYLDDEGSINPANTQEEEAPTEIVVFPEVVENTPIEGEEPLALPASSQKVEEETAVSINPETEDAEEDVPLMESLLSDDPEYKAFYHPVAPVKKKSRALSTMEELLSGKPINRILCLGNEDAVGTAFRQNNRICHPSGIIPTETASGHTLVYIPERPVS